MNINMSNNNQERVIEFLQQTLAQLINYNSIDAHNLLVICHTYYEEYLVHRYREIENLIITIFSYINPTTRIYMNDLDKYEIN